MENDANETLPMNLNSMLTDNLPARQSHIMERLVSIRSNKQRILDTLRGLKENVTDDQMLDKELMAKMIASFDMLKMQEEQYMKLMQQIVGIRENAADDIQHEVIVAKGETIIDESKNNEASEKCCENGEEQHFVKNKFVIDVNDKNSEVVCDEKCKISSDVVENTEKKAMELDADIKSTSKTDELSASNDEDVQELNRELSNLGNVAKKAVLASVVNDELLKTLQLNRNKKTVFDELRRKGRNDQMGEAKKALEQVEMARLKVESEQEEVTRKQKTLERLRKEAQRRGMKLGPGSASEPDIVLESAPEPKSLTEAKLRAKLEAKRKEILEFEEDNGPPVPNDLAPTERIPPIVENKHLDERIKQKDEDGGDVAADNSNSFAITTGNKKKRGKKAQTKEQCDIANTSIREKLASITARKARMRDIRAQLTRPSATLGEMDDNFLKAQEQLKNIMEMRKQLEDIHEKGEQLPEETAKLLEIELDAAESIQSNSAKLVEEEERKLGTPFGESVQVVQEVRDIFEKTMGASNFTSPPFNESTHLSVDGRSAAFDSDRLTHLEQALQGQRQLLEAIASKICQDESVSSTDLLDQFIAVKLKKCLVNASAELLTDLCAALLELAKDDGALNFATSALIDLILVRLLNASKEQQKNNLVVECKDASHHEESERAGREVVSLRSEVPDASSDLIKLIKGGGATYSRIERELSHEITPEEAKKLEQAKRQLNSGRAKLRKQRTLEKVRSRTESTCELSTADVQSKDVDKCVLEGDICKIIDEIVPWIKKHCNQVADEGMLKELRSELLKHSTKVCFPDGLPSDLFTNQLSTIIDETLSQYISHEIGEVEEVLIFDVSEVLYNELAFFQLMSNIDNSIEPSKIVGLAGN